MQINRILFKTDGFSTLKGELLPYIVKKQLSRPSIAEHDKLTSVINANTKVDEIFNVSKPHISYSLPYRTCHSLSVPSFPNELSNFTIIIDKFNEKLLFTRRRKCKKGIFTRQSTENYNFLVSYPHKYILST